MVACDFKALTNISSELKTFFICQRVIDNPVYVSSFLDVGEA